MQEYHSAWHAERVSWVAMGAVLAGFFVVALFVYGGVLGSGFVRWDDGLLIYENAWVRSLSWSSFRHFFTSYDPELYIPLTLVSYALDHAIGGGEPWIFHLHNLVLHTLNAGLVTWLLALMLRDRRIALFLGLIFLLHPLHTEAVAWASARKDVLATFFFLGACISYLYALSSNRQRWFFLSLLLFTLGLMAKVVIITLPIVLLLLDALTRRPLSKCVWTDKLPFLGVAVVFGIVALFGKTDVTAASTLLEKILLAGKGTVFYVWKFVAPTGLSVIYPYTEPIRLTNPDLLVPLVLSLGLVGAAILLWRRMREVSVGLLFFLLTVAPTFLNVAKGGDYYFASDRYAYIPSIGLLIVVGALVMRWMPDVVRRSHAAWIAPGAAVVVLVMLGVLARAQAAVWSDSESLFENVVAHYPDSHVAHNNLGNVYRRKGEYEEAVREFQAALAIRPHVKTLSNLGGVLRAQGKFDEAVEAYRRALGLDPASAMAHFGMGLVEEARGRIDAALEQYRRALTLDPAYAAAHVNIGSILLARGDREGAEREYRKAIELEPAFPDAHYNLGVLLLKAGRNEEAVGAFREAVRHNPWMVHARLNLGVLLFNHARDIDAAREQFEVVLEIDPGNAAARQALEQMGE